MSWEPINPATPKDSELIGDEPFDIIANALERVMKCYEQDLGRKPTALELVKTFERVLAPRFGDAVQKGATEESVSVWFKTKHIPRRQKFVLGDV
ncbi:MAG TPA: hypothetical protein VNT76_19865, partial [Candidatus Binatus sp.]|nr:hypothetical protein [Candidatus Binatus sp.]